LHTGGLVKNRASANALYVSTLIQKPNERVSPNLFLEYENKNTYSTKQHGYANVKGNFIFYVIFHVLIINMGKIITWQFCILNFEAKQHVSCFLMFI
jgi:hypothetical protein